MSEIDGYFSAELDRLRRTARAFGRDNPALARALEAHAGDPDVERLLEGVAFLVAGLRSRVDAAADDAARSLAEVIAPQVLAPLPAAAIVELAPQLRSLRARHRVPGGRELKARAGGVACRFRTCFDVDLRPLQVRACRLAEGPGPVFEVDLEVGEAALLDSVPLRLYLHHEDLGEAATLLLWLTRHLRGVTVVGAGGPLGRLPATALRPLAPTAWPVLPWPELAPAAQRAVLELFVLPERSCFVELEGLHELRPPEGPMTLRFELDRPPPLAAAPPAECVRLHCVPVINLFDAPGEPIRREGPAREAIVRADGLDPRHVEVREVVAVVASGRDRQRRALVPFARALGATSGTYSLRRAAGGWGGTDTFLRIHEPAGPSDEVLSLDLVCSNGRLPAEMRTGEAWDAGPGGLIRGCTNVTSVTPPVPAALGRGALWRLLAHLVLAPRGPADVEALRGLLRLYNVDPGSPRGRVGARMITAIGGLRREAVARVVRGAPISAVRTTVEVDEAAVGGVGPAFLLGQVLDALCAAYAPLGTASELRLELTPRRESLAWPVRLS